MLSVSGQEGSQSKLVLGVALGKFWSLGEIYLGGIILLFIFGQSLCIIWHFMLTFYVITFYVISATSDYCCYIQEILHLYIFVASKLARLSSLWFICIFYDFSVWINFISKWQLVSSYLCVIFIPFSYLPARTCGFRTILNRIGDSKCSPLLLT